jgi:hypothetical protein
VIPEEQTVDLGTAYALASEIEWIHAKDRVRLLRSRNRIADAEMEYDPLAATCLGDLIYSVANGGTMRTRHGDVEQEADRNG